MSRKPPRGGPRPLRSNFFCPTTALAPGFIKARAYHDQDVLIVSVEDPNLSWDQREILKQVATKLYGEKARVA